jgi:hypothetical protein
MSVPKLMQKCPFCLEPIIAGATRCKNCQADLSTSANRPKAWLTTYNTFRVGFLTGLLFGLIVAILIYGHFYLIP